MTGLSRFPSPVLVLAPQAQHLEALQSQASRARVTELCGSFPPLLAGRSPVFASLFGGLTPASNGLPSNHLDSQGEPMASEKSPRLPFPTLGVEL